MAANAISPPTIKLKFMARTNKAGLAAAGVAVGSPL
jgi:hypothetical protein